MHESRRGHRYWPLIPLLGDLEQHLNRTEITVYRRNHKIWADTAGPFWVYSRMVVKRACGSYILSMHESRRDHRYCPLIPLLGDLEQHLNRTESTGYRRNHKISAHTAGPFWLYSWVVVKRTCSGHISIHDRRRRHRYWLFTWLLVDLDQHWIAAESAGYRRKHKMSADIAGPFWVCV
jgi:hypothetical protein